MTEPKAKGGRPVSTGRGAKLGKRIMITLSQDEHARIEQAARDRGVAMSAYIRSAALALATPSST